MEGLTTANMDHHGLVAALCKDLQITKRIDKRLLPDASRKVSPGVGVVAMIINGLGYTNRTLYMSDHFFASKPIERLLGPHLQAEDLTDHTLAHGLDDIAEYGASKLFMEVAMEIALDNNLLSQVNHLDTTSFSLEGSYQGEENEQVISITHGYSKDHRPDLKQVVLSLVVNGPSAIPICMEALSGNSSDKVSFHQTISKVEAFKRQIDLDQTYTWVADAALYTRDKLLKDNTYTWLTRVPENIKQARELLAKPDEAIDWQQQANGYKISSYTSHYGDIEQRWLLVYSQQSYQKEQKTLESKLEKEKEKLKQCLWHLSKQVFSCEKDAKKAIDQLAKKQKLLTISYQIESIKGYLRPGKPHSGEEQVTKGYQVVGDFTENEQEILLLLRKKGRFILASNKLDQEGLSDQAMLATYKGQQKVEGGFRFLKDPWFMVDSVYLKLERRIEALMMIMTLTLLVYNVGQYKMRKQLSDNQATIPNQLGKAISNPTLRWVFQILEGIGVIYLNEQLTSQKEVSYISNMTPLRDEVVRLFGLSATSIYGINEQKKGE